MNQVGAHAAPPFQADNDGRTERLPTPRRRFRGSLTSYLTFLLLLFLFLTVTLSLERAEWAPTMPSLTVVLVLALLTGWALAGRPWRGVWHHLLALVLGAVVTLLWVSRMAPGTTWGMQQSLSAISSWLRAAFAGGSDQGELAFALFLIALTWAVGYLGAWSVFRGRKAWWAIVPAAVVLLINLANLPKDFHIHFYMFLLASCLLLAHSHFVGRQREWLRQGLVYPRQAPSFLLAQAFGFALVGVGMAWLLPSTAPLGDMVAKVQKPAEFVQDKLDRLFTSLTVKKPIQVIGDEGKGLPFGGTPFELGEKTLFVTKSALPWYWKSRTYDAYTSQGWLSSPEIQVPLQVPLDAPLPLPEGKAETVTASIIMKVYTLKLFSPAYPQEFSLPSVADVRPLEAFILDMNDASQDSKLPPELAAIAGTLRSQAGAGTLVDSSAHQLLPPEYQMLETIRTTAKFPKFRVGRRVVDGGDIASVRKEGIRLLGPRQGYQVTWAVPKATPEELGQAGTKYPDWIAQRYLQLPATLPDKVKQLSATITANASTPYDKAQNIMIYLLMRYPYNRDVPGPPENEDYVDYFLFSRPEGFCEHFASAMTVMLRSVGVPARFVVGYMGGSWNKGLQGYEVKEKDYHAWVEVYFPGYGWVQFDPTPAGGDAVEFDIPPEDFEFPGAPQEEPPAAPAPAASTQPRSWFTMFSWALAGVMGLAFAWLWIRFWFSWQDPKRSFTEDMYGRMCRLATLARLKPQRYQTPEEFARRLSYSLPAGTPYIQTIAGAYIKDRYGRRKVLTPIEMEEVQAAWSKLRFRLARHILRLRDKRPAS